MKTSAQIMVDEFRTDPEKLKRLAEAPMATLEEVAKESAKEIPNTKVYWLIVGCIGGLAAVMVIGLIVFYSLERELNLEAYFGILGLLVGALAGALVPSDRGGENR